MKRHIAFILVIIMIAVMLTACSSDSITLNKPEDKGTASNGKPQFRLSWSKVTDADEYQIAILAEGDGFSVRSTKNIYNGDTETTVVFLQGVYTDTVKYTIKVGPVLNSDEPAFWSNLYVIDFVNGESSVSETSEDFDNNVETEQEETFTDTKTLQQSAASTKSDHVLPQSFIDFMNEEFSSSYTTSDIVSVDVGVNHDYYAEPVQHITDESTMAKFKSAIDYMTVTEEIEDDTVNIDTYYSFSVNNSDGQIFYFEIQNNMLVTNYGKYNVDGISMLLDNSGIMLESQWNEYWESYNAVAEEYAQNYEFVAPAPILSAAGYSTNVLSQLSADQIKNITIYIASNDEAGKLSTSDTSQIDAVMNALRGMTANDKVSSPSGQSWYITFTYQEDGKNFTSSAVLSFTGDTINIGDNSYTLAGQEELFNTVDTAVLKYLRDHRNENKIDPVY